MNRFIQALKENKDGIRQKLATAVLTVAGAVAAGIILNHRAEDRVDVLVIQESRPEEPVTEDFAEV